MVTAVAGIVLAVHGWSGRQSGLTPGALGGSGSPAPAGSSGSPSPGGSLSPAKSPKASAPAGHATRPPAGKAGPVASSPGYAGLFFPVMAGTPGATGGAAPHP